jgi:hypothetical protein
VTQTITDDGAAAALEDMRAMLEHDGYLLDVGIDRGRLVLSISATPDACAECLVPKDLLTSVAVDMLGKAGLVVAPQDVHLEYPSDGDHAS